MALTVTRTKVFCIGDRKEVQGTITFDSSYATGGLSLTGTDLGLELELNRVNFEPLPTRYPTYDYTNKKALLHTAVGTEAANASDQSAITVRFRAVGKGSAAA